MRRHQRLTRPQSRQHAREALHLRGLHVFQQRDRPGPCERIECATPARPCVLRALPRDQPVQQARVWIMRHEAQRPECAFQPPRMRQRLHHHVAPGRAARARIGFEPIAEADQRRRDDLSARRHHAAARDQKARDIEPGEAERPHQRRAIAAPAGCRDDGLAVRQATAQRQADPAPHLVGEEGLRRFLRSDGRHDDIVAHRAHDLREFRPQERAREGRIGFLQPRPGREIAAGQAVRSQQAQLVSHVPECRAVPRSGKPARGSVTRDPSRPGARNSLARY